MESLRGQLLIASPRIVDPSFHRTVVLMTAHDANGAMGLVLNRPADGLVAELVPDLAWLAEDGDEPVWIGGPVAATGVVVVAEFGDPRHAAVVVDGDIGLVAAGIEEHVELVDGLRRRRFFAGHAGWGPGQLEAEREEDSWIVEPVDPEDVFTAEPEELWASILRRKGREFALLATMPDDPSLN